jgi:hypothetical protein
VLHLRVLRGHAADDQHDAGQYPPAMLIVLARYGPGDWALAIITATFACIPLGISVWALLDAAHRPEWAWALAGRRRVAWMAAIMFGVLTVIGGLIISAWYLTSIRPRIRAAEEGDLNA